MKKLFLAAALISVFIGSSMANAINLPTYHEYDLDNWTRLYATEFSEGDRTYPNGDPAPAVAPGDVIPIDTTAPFDPDTNLTVSNQPGDMSRAILTFNQLGPTLGPGGGDLPATWVGGTTDGTYLHGWEDNVVIMPTSAALPAGGAGSYSPQGGGIVNQDDGSTNFYYTHNPDGGWEFEVYQTTITTTDLITNSNFLQGGASTMSTIQSNIAGDAGSVPYLRGMFSESLYFDPALAAGGYNEGFGPGVISALVGISISSEFVIGGLWLNQLTLPFGLGVNAFVDVDPTWGIGAMYEGGFYGFSPSNGDPYDLAIQNVNLFSENTFGDDGEIWVISDDGVRGSATIPEPATMLLLGTGLVGVAGVSRRRRKNQA